MTTSTLPPVNLYSSQHTLVAQQNVNRSKALSGFGIAEVVFSIFLFSSCIWSASIRNTTITSYLGFFCAILHAILGSFAIVGGINVNKYRNYVIATLILSIVATCIVTVIVMTTDIIEWGNWPCWQCSYYYWKYKNNQNYNLENYYCPRYCFIDVTAIFLPILIFLILEAIVAVVLSGIACCNLSCCKHQSPPQMSAYQFTIPQPNVPISNYMPNSQPFYLFTSNSNSNNMPMPSSEPRQQFGQLNPQMLNPPPRYEGCVTNDHNVANDHVAGAVAQNK